MGGLFKTKVPEQKLPEPKRMPDTEDPEALEARRRKRRSVFGQGGRASTILEKRGGEMGAYVNERLGQ